MADEMRPEVQEELVADAEAEGLQDPGCSEEEARFKVLRDKMMAILTIHVKQHTKEEMNEYWRLKKQFNKQKEKFPHLVVKKSAMTAAEKMRLSRERQDEAAMEKQRAADRALKSTEEACVANRAGMATEEARAADRAQKATDEARAATRARIATEENLAATRARVATEENQAANRARRATEENQAADRARKAAERAAMDDTVQARERAALRQRMVAGRAKAKINHKDGLHSELVLRGCFGVPANHIGEMSRVCVHCGARKFEKETGSRACCLDGKVALKRFTKPSDPFLQLWFKDDFEAVTFCKYSRSFNNGLCLSSLCTKEHQFRNGYNPSIVF